MKINYFRPLLVLIFLLISGCKKANKAHIQNLNGGRIDVIGHAGSGFLYPMFPFNPLPPNSSGSIKKALANRADGIEVDIQMSADNVLILYHDTNLEALSGIDGCISQHAASKILHRKYDTGFFYNLFHDEEAISFEQLLKWISTLDRHPLVHLDIKNFDDCLQTSVKERADIFAKKIHHLIEEYRVPKEKLVLGSSDKNLLRALKSLDCGLTLMLDGNGSFDASLDWVLEHKMHGLIISSAIAEKTNIQKAHQKAIKVVVFGGKSRSGIVKIIEKNPDAIQVNNVKLLRRLLD